MRGRTAGPREESMNSPQTSRDGIDRHVGGRLRFHRERAGLEVSQVADTLGLSIDRVHAFEGGRERANAAMLFEFGKLLNTPVAYFFTSEDFEARQGI